jgi:carbon monoxide dehydrogenase subunit G
MHLEAERVMPQPVATVWAALNDPAVLAACIPGCQRLERREDGTFDAVVAARVGPLQTTLRGRLRIDAAEPPSRCRLSGEGEGKAAGFARGQAIVSLDPVAGGGTRLAYQVEASVGGKLAQLGQRLIDLAARDFADAFFDRLAARLTADADAAAGGGTVAATAAAPAATVAAGPRRPGLKPAVWVPALIVLTLALLFLFSRG